MKLTDYQQIRLEWQMSKCDVRQYSDMAKCDKCGFCWDMNDPYEPECKMHQDQKHEHEKTPKNAVKALVFILVFFLPVVFLCN